MQQDDRVIVVTRQLLHLEPVVTAVIALPDELKKGQYNEVNNEQYLTAKAEEAREKFCKQFAEFNSATWTYTIVRMTTPYYHA